MPNAINPNDFNVDYFSSGFLGVTTVNDFREYLLQNNLEDLPQELVTGAAGNFTDDFNEKGLEKDINYSPITNPGSIDEWNLAGNFEVSLFDISYQNPSQNVGTNEYGPAVIQPYNEPGLVPQETGFKQYPTSSGGDDLKQALKDFALNDQLNLGPGSAINFESELNDVAKERRKKEAVNRLKLKAKNQVLGKLNLDPFGLLAGQDLILKDYDITTRPTVGGKILNFVTDAIGVEIPTSPIPDGAFGKWGDSEGPQSYEDLMKSTGAGTKSLIFNAVSANKYGPILQEPSGKAAKNFGAGQAPQPKKYTDNVEQEFKSNALLQEEKPLVDRINQQVGKIISNISRQAGVGVPEKDLTPQEFEYPSTETDNLIKNKDFGFDSLSIESANLLGSPKGSGKFGIDTWGTSGQAIAENDDTIGTKIPSSGGEYLNDRVKGEEKGKDGEPLSITEGVGGKKPYNDTSSFESGMYWAGNKEGKNPFRRGLLKYTQDLVNDARNDRSSKARYIGAVNSPENFSKKTGRHNQYSMGNTVFEGGGLGKDGTFNPTSYCRSWSVRNPYKKVKDLIRHGAGNEDGSEFTSLTTPDQNLSVLGNNGFVKVAPYVTDGWKDSEGNLKPASIKLGNPTIQKYMLSIENLAWQNTDHALKLPPCEVGPNGGRIMWFPPYDINFTDNSSVNWDSTQIIGRGEPIYTYNSTERTGTLSFKVVVDHSTVMTEIKKDGEAELLKYFAGCKNPIEAAIPILPINEIQEIKIAQLTETNIIPKKEVPNPPTPPNPIKFLFRNAYKFEKDKYGTTLATELAPNADLISPNYPKSAFKKNPDGYLRGDMITTLPYKEGPDGNPIPNPAFSGATESGYTQNLYDTHNERSLLDLEEMVKFLVSEEGKRFKIKILGKTSDAGVEPRNDKLGLKRANTTKDYMLKLMQELEIEVGRIPALQLGSQRDFPSETTWRDDSLRWDISTTGEEGQNLSQSIEPSTGQVVFFDDEDSNFSNLVPDVTVPSAVKDRNATIVLEYNPEIDDLFTIDNQEQTVTTVTREASSEFREDEREATESEALAQILAARASRYMAWECSYFQKMKQEDSFIYENLQQKLKYFHPAFHSMTPEGFNSRLTFLKQCTRQGPNIAEGEPSNLAFGKPPICVLRVGDFYHTKIVIDSVNLTFDPLQWDLNPEGIGVQPMVCSVDLNFKFIGGSSLGGPISQLQNSVGFNFFANTGLYNPRTIYSSTQDYNKSKPDSSTGLGSDISNGQINNTEGTNLFGFGAYIKPGEVIYNGDIGNEGDILPPPVNEALENIKRKQIEDERIEAEETAKLKQEELDAINEQFDKKVDERAGAFTVSFVQSTSSKLTPRVDKSGSAIDICSGDEANNKLYYVVSDQESLTKVVVYYQPESGTGSAGSAAQDIINVASINTIISNANNTFNVTTSGPFTALSGKAYGSPYPSGIESPSKDPVLNRVILLDTGDKKASPLYVNDTSWKVPGILNGTYTVKAYANVNGNIAEDGTSKTKEITAETSFTIRCNGFDDAGIGINVENNDTR